MKIKSKKAFLFVPFIMIIFLCIVLYLIFNFLLTTTFGSKINSKTIIQKFKNNEQLFEEAAIELTTLEEEYIYFSKDGDYISISIHEHDKEKVNVIKVNEKDFYKYEKTIKIMKGLNLEKVSKEVENIDFLFNSMIKFAQYIVKIENEENYKNSYSIKDMKEIKDNWYYVETK